MTAMSKKPITDILNLHRQVVLHDYNKGKSIDDLARDFNCSATPIRNFLLDNGIKMRPAIRPKLLQKHAKAIEALYQSGVNTRQIARQFHVDRNTVSYFLKSRGIIRNTSLAERSFFITTESDKGMLAGLVLGEGSIIIRGRLVRISIANTESAIIGWLAKFGGTIHWSKPRKGARNPCAVWHLSRTVDVFHCLLSILPLLVGKKKSLAVAALGVIKVNHGLKYQRASEIV